MWKLGQPGPVPERPERETSGGLRLARDVTGRTSSDTHARPVSAPVSGGTGAGKSIAEDISQLSSKVERWFKGDDPAPASVSARAGLESSSDPNLGLAKEFLRGVRRMRRASIDDSPAGRTDSPSGRAANTPGLVLSARGGGEGARPVPSAQKGGIRRAPGEKVGDTQSASQGPAGANAPGASGADWLAGMVGANWLTGVAGDATNNAGIDSDCKSVHSAQRPARCDSFRILEALQ